MESKGIRFGKIKPCTTRTLDGIIERFNQNLRKRRELTTDRILSINGENEQVIEIKNKTITYNQLNPRLYVALETSQSRPLDYRDYPLRLSPNLQDIRDFVVIGLIGRPYQVELNLTVSNNRLLSPYMFNANCGIEPRNRKEKIRINLPQLQDGSNKQELQLRKLQEKYQEALRKFEKGDFGEIMNFTFGLYDKINNGDIRL